MASAACFHFGSRSFAVFCTVVGLFGASPPADGQLVTTDRLVPPPTGVYVDTGVTPVDLGGGNSILPGATWFGFSHAILPPAAPTTITTTTRMFGTFRQGTVDSFFDVFVDLDLLIDKNQSPPSAPENIPIEILSMNLTGGGLPGGVRIRESATRGSGGGTTISLPVGGYYHVESFFDVFVELSVDGGTTWNPGDRALHMHLTSTPTPEPATLFLGGAALAAAVRRRRKPRRHDPA